MDVDGHERTIMAHPNYFDLVVEGWGRESHGKS